MRGAVVTIVSLEVDIADMSDNEVRGAFAGWGLTITLVEENGPAGGWPVYRLTGPRDAMIAALSTIDGSVDYAREYVRENAQEVA